jgi:CrcB protein
VKTAVCVAIGGALGALARYGLSLLFGVPAAGAFPAATFAANVAGCLLIGLLGGCAAARPLPGTLREFLGTGVLGGFTTLSAFGVETVRLVGEGHAAMAALYAGASAAAGLGAAAAGHALARSAFGAARRDAA